MIPEEGLQASVDDITGRGSRRRPWLWFVLVCWLLAGVLYRCHESSVRAVPPARAELPTIECGGSARRPRLRRRGDLRPDR